MNTIPIFSCLTIIKREERIFAQTLGYICSAIPDKSDLLFRQENNNENMEAPGVAVEGFQPYANTHSYFTETLFAAPQTQSFLDKFNSDVIAEFGTKQEGGNKIHMIAFKE